MLLRRLLATTSVLARPAKDLRVEATNAHGKTILAVKSVSRQGVTIYLPMASGAGDYELIDRKRVAHWFTASESLPTVCTLRRW